MSPSSLSHAMFVLAIALGPVCSSPVTAQDFNTCHSTSPETYVTDVVAQRGLLCTIELRLLGIGSAQIVTAPTNGRAEIHGAIPILTYQSSATYVGRDRIVLRVSGRQVPTGSWTFRIVVR